MSSEQTPYTASVRAVTSPTRRPVNGPGPTPTAMPVSAATVTPAAVSTCSIPGASISPCRIDSSDSKVATTDDPSWSATVTCGVAVSKASSTGPSLSDEQLAPPGAHGAQLEGAYVVGAAGQGELEPVDRECLGQALTPLHHRHRVDDVGVEVEVVDLGRTAEAVGGDVDQRRGDVEGGVHA